MSVEEMMKRMDGSMDKKQNLLLLAAAAKSKSARPRGKSTGIRFPSRLTITCITFAYFGLAYQVIRDPLDTKPKAVSVVFCRPGTVKKFVNFRMRLYKFSNNMQFQHHSSHMRLSASLIL